MHYSLRDRFRGTLLGAALGETLGINCQNQLVDHQPITWATVDQWGFHEPETHDFKWGALMVQHINRLLPPLVQAPAQTSVQANAAKPGNDHESLINSTIGPQSVADDSENFKNSEHSEHSKHPENPENYSSAAGLAVATLPLALFYHDDLNQLQENLENALAAYHQPSSSTTGTIVVGYTIALALRETLHPSSLIPRLLTNLDIHDRDRSLAQQLTQVQNWLEQGITLAQVRTFVRATSFNTLPSTPIALALYGFLSTPDHVRLTLLRTARLLHQPQISCAIAGAIAGAYNSTAGLPFVLQHHLHQRLQHADLLLAAWSGVHIPNHWLNAATPSAVTAAPFLIRHHRH